MIEDYYCFDLGAQRTSLTPERSAMTFKELRQRGILLGGLPVDIEAPFVFCASMSCRAGS